MAIKAAAFNQGKYPTIAFTNLATTPLGTDLGKLVSALDKQMQRDFVPIWGYPTKLYVTDKPKPDEWQVVFLDDADAANALGYHDITKDGQPVSKVFVRTTIAAGQKVSVTASHELLEMMIDPGAQLWAQNAGGLFYAYEMCDAVEEQEYEIDGVAVSDFVHPAFFEPWHAPRSTQFDHLGRVSQPFQTLQMGYQTVSNGTTVQEIFGSRAKERHFRTMEIRKMHRSEYRKRTALGTRKRARSASMADTDMSTAHAAALHHAGQLLTALATMVDPFRGDPFELAERRRPDGVIDPFPGDPFELAARRQPTDVVDPLPGDPFEL
jgi:hypothetical protein